MTSASFPSPAWLTRVADAALEGPWRQRELTERFAAIVPVHTGGADALAALLLEHFSRPPSGDPVALARELSELPGLARTLDTSTMCGADDCRSATVRKH